MKIPTQTWAEKYGIPMWSLFWNLVPTYVVMFIGGYAWGTGSAWGWKLIIAWLALSFLWGFVIGVNRALKELS